MEGNEKSEVVSMATEGAIALLRAGNRKAFVRVSDVMYDAVRCS